MITITSICKTRLEAALLLGSVGLGLAYLLDSFGISAPYPADVAIKAAGIVLLAAYAWGRRHPVLAWALLAGAAGDVALALEPPLLLAGMAAFAVGHGLYIALLWRWRHALGSRGVWGWLAAAGLVAYGIVMLVWLQPYFADLRGPASAYLVIILTMAVLAVTARTPALAVAGALIFVVSDSVLAVRLFTDLWPGADWVVWTTYFSAQFLIATGLARGAS
ncbi:lysoplasmalogenase [Maricaulis sp. CAU 1757]